MQLHFLPRELDLLADILLNQSGHDRLLDQVMTRQLHLDLDELDQLREILSAEKHLVDEGTARCTDPQKKRILEARQLLLDSMIEKVGEACAML
jgi:hypothetical protein